MPLEFIVPDFNPSFFVESEWPVPENLAAIFDLSGSQAEAIINRVNPGTPATVTGTPTYDANGATLSQTNYFDTNCGGSTENLSLWGVFKLPTVAGDHMFIGNYSSAGGGTGDSLLYVNSGTSLRASGAGGGGAANAGVSAAGVGTDYFFGAAIFTAAGTKVWLGHAGTLTSGSSGADRSPLNSADFLLGRGVTAFTTQAARSGFVGINRNRALSDENVAEAFAFCAARYAAKGITDLAA